MSGCNKIRNTTSIISLGFHDAIIHDIAFEYFYLKSFAKHSALRGSHPTAWGQMHSLFLFKLLKSE